MANKETDAIRDVADIAALVVDTAKAAKEFVEKWAKDISQPQTAPEPKVETSEGPQASQRLFVVPDPQKIGFTEERIRKVAEKHYPHFTDDDGEIGCGCSDEWIPRKRCFYCKTKLPGEHHPKCERPSEMAAEEKKRGFTIFDIDHFIDALKTMEV